MKKIYLSGPMAGIKNLNKKAFDEAEKFWGKKGYCTVNPYKVAQLNKDYTYNQHMGMDLHQMLFCDCVAVLDGWKNSKGARIEIFVASKLDLPIYDTSTGKKIHVKSELILNTTENPNGFN